MTRAAGEIGSGLAPAREARPIPRRQRLHVVGIGGAGASAAALLGRAVGATVTGCDAGGPSPYTVAVARAGIPMEWRHDPAHVVGDHEPGVDRLAVTKALTAVDPGHPELLAARQADLPVEPWQQVIADAALVHGGRLVAVAGTHGKSTAAGWLVHLLAAAGRDPAAFVGALLPARLTDGTPATARWGAGDAFVVEADEYAGNFDPFRPDVAVLLNVEWDHPDVFGDEAAVLDAFEGWLGAPGAAARTLVANAGDPGVARLLRRLGDWPGEIVRVALEPRPGVVATVTGRLDGDRLEVRGLVAGAEPLATPVGLAGRHNAANALCVAAAAAGLGVEPDAIAAGIAGFGGVGRRMEVKGEPAGVLVVDDYAHHPTAIRATIEAVRGRWPGRRLWAVYEPLTFHRTAAMLGSFADVLATADRAVVADIWAGRDPDTSVTSAGALSDAISRRARHQALAPGSVEATADLLAVEVRPGDIVLVMGGGRSYLIADRLIQRLGG